MELYKKLKCDFEFGDYRGKLTQLVHSGYSQINILETHKGVTRGSHYHKEAEECFYVISGKVRVTLTYKGQTQTLFFESGDFFKIYTFVVHSMYFPEDCIMIAMYDIPVEKPDGSKDIYNLGTE